MHQQPHKQAKAVVTAVITVGTAVITAVTVITVITVNVTTVIEDLTSGLPQDVLNSAEARAAAYDRGIPGLSPADRSFSTLFARLPQNDLSAGLEPGIPRSDAAALTSAPLKHHYCSATYQL